MRKTLVLLAAASMMVVSACKSGESAPEASSQEPKGVEAECRDLGVVLCEARAVELLNADADIVDDPGVPYLKAACRLGGQSACTRYGQLLVYHRQGKEGVAVLHEACERAHGDACLRLGEIYQSGLGGLERQHGLAVEAYERGCRLGAAAACFNRGAYWMTGRGGTKKDVERGLELMVGGCKAGYEEGCVILAKQGVDVSRFEAKGTDVDPGAAVTKRQDGVDWVVAARLADRLQVKKVSCQEPFRAKKMCHLTLVAKDTFGRREPVWATVYDADGAQTDRWGVRTPKKPGAIKQRLRVGVDTARVEFDL